MNDKNLEQANQAVEKAMSLVAKAVTKTKTVNEPIEVATTKATKKTTSK